MLFVLPLALLALLAPKAGTDGLEVPKLVLVAGVTPNRDLLSPNGRLGGLCVPKVPVAGAMPKASVAGVAFAPNMGTAGALLSVEPNIPVVPPKAGVDCTFVVVPTPDVPNAGVVLFVVSKPGVTALVETLPAMPNAGAVVPPVCVVEPNNGAVVLPNMLVAPKDVEGFVWPKTEVPLPNTEGAAVVGVELALALENKLGVLAADDDAALVVETKIEGTVAGVLNILAVSDVVPDPDAAPKSG